MKKFLSPIVALALLTTAAVAAPWSLSPTDGNKTAIFGSGSVGGWSTNAQLEATAGTAATALSGYAPNASSLAAALRINATTSKFLSAFYSTGEIAYFNTPNGSDFTLTTTGALNLTAGGATWITNPLTVTSGSASSMSVGPNGATNPALKVDGSASSGATGVLIYNRAAASGAGIQAISSGTNESLYIDAKGSGVIHVGNTSTGSVSIDRALTYASTTLNNTCTGCSGGSLVGSNAPALTTPNLGTPSALVLTNATGTPTSIGLANGTGLPISTGVSGLGTGVATLLAGTSSGTGGPMGTVSPTTTGTLTAAAANFSSTVAGTASTWNGVSIGQATGIPGLYFSSNILWNVAGTSGWRIANSANGATMVTVADTTGNTSIIGTLAVGSTLTATGTLTAANVSASNPVALGNLTGLYRIDSGGSAGTKFRFLNSSNGIDGIDIGAIARNGTLSATIGTDGSFLLGTTTAGGWSTISKLEAQSTTAQTSVSGYNTGTTSASSAYISRINNTAANLFLFNYNGTNVGAFNTNTTGSAGTGLALSAVGDLDLTSAANGITINAGTGTHVINNLDVTNSATNAVVSIINSGSGGHEFWLDSTNSASSFGGGAFVLFDNTAAAARMVLTATRVSFPTVPSSVSAQSGTLCYNATNGDLTYDPSTGCLASLPELKNFHGEIKGALTTISKIKPYWISWKPTTPEWKGGDHETQPAFNAREVALVDKRLVSYDKNGNLRGVRYAEMTAVLTAAIQEQQKQIAAQAKKIDSLTAAVLKLQHANDNPVRHATFKKAV